MSSTVEKIKDRLTIEEVVSSYIKLDRAGANLKGKCPFHNEKTPSFFVSPERNSYYCFGCGAKGDIFSFVQEFERVDFMGALKLLADKAGVEIEKTVPGVKNEKERLYAVLEEATNFFSGTLERNLAPSEYLQKRGLKPETTKEWRLGYVRDEWNSLENHLKTKGFSQIEMEKAGLIKKGDKGGYYDRFRGRVMFPLFDPSGRVVGFSGRILIETPTASGEPAAKYLNSPETELFDKSMVFYGIHRAKQEILRLGYGILVEGQFDLLLSHQAGVKNVVAVSGTALSGRFIPGGIKNMTSSMTRASIDISQKEDFGDIEGGLKFLKRWTTNLIFAFDSDAAGKKAGDKLGDIIYDLQSALVLDMNVKIAVIPSGMDPADLINRNPEEWKRCLKEAKYAIDYCLDSLISQNLEGQKFAFKVREEIIPLLARVSNSFERDRLIPLIAYKTGFSMEAVREELVKVPRESSKPVSSIQASGSSSPPQSKIGSVERKITGILLWQEGKTPQEVDPNSIRGQLERILGKSQTDDLIALYTNEKEELAFETETYYENASKLSEEVEELFLSLEEEYLKQAFAKKMTELTRAERDKNPELIHALLEECQDISKRLAALYTSNK
jgi:DNA primase